MQIAAMRWSNWSTKRKWCGFAYNHVFNILSNEMFAYDRIFSSMHIYINCLHRGASFAFLITQRVCSSYLLSYHWTSLSLPLYALHLFRLLSISRSLSFFEITLCSILWKEAFLCWAPQMMVFGTLQCWLLRINIPEIFWFFTYLTCRLKFIFHEFFLFYLVYYRFMPCVELH